MSDPLNPTPRELVYAGKVAACAARPYFAAGIHAMVPIEKPGIGTMAVDKYWRMYYDPSLVGKLPVPMIAGIITHELQHLLRMHHARAENILECNLQLANICFPGDSWISDAGKEIGCVGTMKRKYDGPLQALVTQGGATRCTPEHPFWVRRRRHKVGLTPVRLKAPEWVNAKDVRVGDFLCVPTLEKTASDIIDLSPYVRYKSGRGNLHNETLRLDDDLAWFIGLYVAEGSGDNITLSLHAKERETIAAKAQTIAARLGYRSNAYPQGKNGLQVVISASVFGRWLREHVGTESGNKHIPNCILRNKSASIRRSFLDGLVAGDGWTYKRGKTSWNGVGTISTGLVRDLVLLLAQDGLGCHVSTQVNKPRIIGQQYIPWHEIIHSVTFSLAGPRVSTRTMNGRKISSSNARWKADGDGVWYPVKRNKIRRYVGDVYNMETKSHTYVCDSFLVHNCEDLEINDDLLEEKNGRDPITPLPDWVLLPKTFGPKVGVTLKDNQIWETYYRQLKDVLPTCTIVMQGMGGKGKGKEKQDGDGQGDAEGEGQDKRPGGGSCGSCATGVTEKYEDPAPADGHDGVTEPEAEMIRRHIAMEINRISESSTSRGTMPAGFQRWAKEFMTSKVNYMAWVRSALRNAYAETRGLGDYTWRRPARRQQAFGNFVMPGQVTPRFRAAFIIDTSGSMSDSQVGQAIAEVRGFISQMRMGADLYVASCDAAVHSMQKIESISQLKLYGGGGTDMRVAFDLVGQMKQGVNMTVCVTDMETPWPETKPKGVVVLVKVGSGAPPSWAHDGGVHLVDIPAA
jgi:predicted metal-dependent peptidase